VLLAVAISFVYVKGQVDRQKALEGQLNALTWEKGELDRKLRSATTPEERDRLEQEIAAKQRQIDALKTGIASGATTGRKAAKGGGGCTELRACCDEIERAVPADPGNPHRKDECISWTRPDPISSGYGTDDWCDGVLASIHARGLCR